MIKKVLFLATIVMTVLATWLYVLPQPIVHSQGEIEIHCGQRFDIDFTGDVQVHDYVLTIDQRWSFDVSVQPYGEDDLKTVIVLYSPTGRVMKGTNVDNFAFAIPQKSPAISSGTLSAKGNYKIQVANAPVSVSDGSILNDPKNLGGIGYYTLKIGCTTNTGSKIAPGDYQSPTSTPEPGVTPAPTTASDAPPVPAAPSFLESGKSYDVHLNSEVIAVTVVEIRDDGWVRVIIDNRVGWLNLSQVALIVLRGE